MISWWLAVNNVFLLLCCSMYLGTGWSLILFSFPVAKDLTPSNYYLQFVPQVEAATRFFTYMTSLMLISAVVMGVGEPDPAYRWFPVLVFLAVIAATVLTLVYIVPYNKKMAAGITDNAELHSVLDHWLNRNRIRVALWNVEWLAMALWFAGKITHHAL